MFQSSIRNNMLELFQNNIRMLLLFFLRITGCQNHTGQCKRTGGCYNELVVAFFSTGGGVKGKKKPIPVDFIIYL